MSNYATAAHPFGQSAAESKSNSRSGLPKAALLAAVATTVGMAVGLENERLVYLLLPSMIAAAYVYRSDRAAYYASLTAIAAMFLVGTALVGGEAEIPAAALGLTSMLAASALIHYLIGCVQYVEGGADDRYFATIQALSALMDETSSKVGIQHGRTVELADAVAVEMRLESEKADLVRQVALLHDIGKIGVPEEILAKQGNLTNLEWQAVCAHSEIGERIVGCSREFDQVAHAIRHAHERWDGKGYPDGLSGVDIPLSSRIVHACDAYRAMTTDRPHQSATDVIGAREELLLNAGTQFDPVVVDALLRAIDSREQLVIDRVEEDLQRLAAG